MPTAQSPTLSTTVTTMASQDVSDHMPQRFTGFQQGFCYLPSGFACFPNKGYAGVGCVSTSTCAGASAAQRSQDASRTRMLTTPVGGSQQVGIVHPHVQRLPANMEKCCCGGLMHPDKKPVMASPQVASALMAREQTDRTISQPALPSAGDGVTKAQRVATNTSKKTRPMMPAVNLQPTVPNVRPRRRGSQRPSTRAERRSRARRDSQSSP